MSPRTDKQFKEIREEKKALIMDVALELFANEGLNTPISKIAKKANISKGLMYNYFSSKEDLIKEIALSGFNDIIELFDPDHDGILTDEEFEYFIDQTFIMISSNIQYWRLYFSIVVQPKVLDLIKDEFMTFIPAITKIMSNFFKARGSEDPEGDAMFFNAVMDGITMNYVMNPELFDLNKLKSKIIRMFIQNSKS